MLRHGTQRSQVRSPLWFPFYLLTGLCLALLLLSGCESEEAQSSASKGNQSVVDAFRQVKAALAKSGLPAGLVGDLDTASRNYDAGQSCDAATALEKYLQNTQAARQGTMAPIAEDFYNRGHALRADILTYLPQGVTCNAPRFGRSPQPSLDESSNKLLSATVTLGEPVL